MFKTTHEPHDIIRSDSKRDLGSSPGSSHFCFFWSKNSEGSNLGLNLLKLLEGERRRAMQVGERKILEDEKKLLVILA